MTVQLSISRSKASPLGLPPIGPALPWLAPMAGYTDLPFRLLCREFGAACAVTELVSAKGLAYDGIGSKDLLATCPADDPLVAQLFGCEPAMFERAMDMLLGAGFTWFDLNCGCSVPKVTRRGAGSALLRTPELLRLIVNVMVRKAGPGRVGVKLRSGWDATHFSVFEIAKALEDEGAAWLTLHPRTARQGFSGQANWEHVAALKELVSLPVIASGDLFTASDARLCLALTNASGVMFARGALYDPAIFTHFLTNGERMSSGARIARLIERHAALIVRYGNPDRAIVRMRSIVPRYVRNLPGASAFRREASTCSSFEHLADITGRIAMADAIPSQHGASTDENHESTERRLLHGRGSCPAKARSAS